jgi:crotonobetainyl-CoA:carnitine CoA-transferase CaiB-like acyl-CoA transferase
LANQQDRLTVLELAPGAAASHCSRLLGALGARVVKVVSEGEELGLPELDTEKEVLSTDSTTEIEGVLRRTDVLIRQCEDGDTDSGPFGLAGLRERFPGLITVAITPFGESGPNAGHRATDLISLQAGGLGYGTPPRVTDPEKENPLGIPGDVVQPLAGLVGAIGVEHALLLRDADGRGRHVEVSEQEAVASVMFPNIATFVDTGVSPGRLASDRPGARRQFLPASDGFLVMMAQRPHHLRAFIGLLGEAGKPLLARLEAGEPQGHVVRDLPAASDAWTSSLTRREVTDRVQARHIPIEPVLNPAEVLECAQLGDRGFWQLSPDGTRVAGDPFGPNYGGARQAPRSVPALARRDAWAGISAASGPLAGVRVIDFTWVLAGPIATRILALLGATVIKVEAPGSQPDSRGSFFLRTLQGGKHSAHLNMKDDDDRAVVETLVREADVLVENFSTGVMERFGLGWDRLREVNPGLTMLSISGMGRTGPYGHHVMLGQLAQGYSGLTSIVGYDDGQPRGLEDGGFWSDPVTGYAGAIGVLAALRERALTGQGRRLDISLLEATAATLFAPLVDAARGKARKAAGNYDPRMAPHDTYRCGPSGEDSWVALAVQGDPDWQALCEVIGRPEIGTDTRFATLAARQENRVAIREAIESWSRHRTPAEAAAACQAAGIAAAPCRKTSDLLADEHLISRGYFVQEDGKPVCVAPAWRLHPATDFIYGPAAGPGQDSDLIRRAVGAETS